MRWTVTIIYILTIYSTLGIVRSLTESIRATGNLRILTVLLVGLFLFFLIFSRQGKITGKPFILRLILAGCFISLANIVARMPEERMHLIEYGLLGWLIGWSLEGCRMTVGRVCLAITLGWSIGLGDEIIQYFLPNRVYDLRDVILNGLSVTLGLLFFLTSKAGCPHKGSRCTLKNKRTEE